MISIVKHLLHLNWYQFFLKKHFPWKQFSFLIFSWTSKHNDWNFCLLLLEICLLIHPDLWRKNIGDFSYQSEAKMSFYDRDTGNNEISCFLFVLFSAPRNSLYPNFLYYLCPFNVKFKSNSFTILLRSISFFKPFPEDNGDESLHSFESKPFDLISWPDIQLNLFPSLTFYLARRETRRDVGRRHHIRQKKKSNNNNNNRFHMSNEKSHRTYLQSNLNRFIVLRLLIRWLLSVLFFFTKKKKQKKSKNKTLQW